ncbi:5'-methylthioadenosine/S-adenosylhomocysteine nucleosidase [Bifidobacterium tsurumiense]|uniref:5'-methylthioadenosine nucleosidase n=1 Tax=Bifidobacterium tsurumiense TaxID=356829 RepID=A0A087EC74_9BIFI|nr:5'-methylthioadenosine/S-adenosylhomocysteine nucleosidase [Bifidobacterium tsurumiense]KFJ05375.1 5'-methylthioadenosine nucleosidase [Bifidobacterium tsurumiense]
MRAQRIAVLCALDKEIAQIEAALDGAERQERYGVTIITGRRGSATVTAVVGGMGKSAAAAAAQLLIMLAQPDVLIFTGIAGGLNPALQVSDVVIGTSLHYLETNTAIIAECDPWLESFVSDESLVEFAERSLESLGYRRTASLQEAHQEALDKSSQDACPQTDSHNRQCPVAKTGEIKRDLTSHAVEECETRHYVRGTIATSDQFNTEAEVLDLIRSTIYADCEEMEGAAAAHISAKNRVPFVAIRAISNQCGESYESLDEHQDALVKAANAAAAVTLGVVNSLIQSES